METFRFHFLLKPNKEPIIVPSKTKIILKWTRIGAIRPVKPFITIYSIFFVENRIVVSFNRC
jgi:hypothetical protein